MCPSLTPPSCFWIHPFVLHHRFVIVLRYHSPHKNHETNYYQLVVASLGHSQPQAHSPWQSATEATTVGPTLATAPGTAGAVGSPSQSFSSLLSSSSSFARKSSTYPLPRGLKSKTQSKLTHSQLPLSTPTPQGWPPTLLRHRLDLQGSWRRSTSSVSTIPVSTKLQPTVP